VRSEATRRNVKYDSVPDLFRVVVFRMNMARHVSAAARGVKVMNHDYGTTLKT
jgi:hypothetical protein